MSKAFWRDLKSSLLGGKILFCRDPLAIDVSGAGERIKASPSTKRWNAEEIWDAACGCNWAQVHMGSSPSAQQVANCL